ncbi:unnamed protein product, partial [Nesidiocoris tenuis]
HLLGLRAGAAWTFTIAVSKWKFGWTWSPPREEQTLGRTTRSLLCKPREATESPTSLAKYVKIVKIPIVPIESDQRPLRDGLPEIAFGKKIRTKFRSTGQHRYRMLRDDERERASDIEDRFGKEWRYWKHVSTDGRLFPENLYGSYWKLEAEWCTGWLLGFWNCSLELLRPPLPRNSTEPFSFSTQNKRMHGGLKKVGTIYESKRGDV